MDSDEGKIIVGGICIIALLVAFIFLMACVSAYNAAKAFNEITGANITTWQAAWVPLAVVGSPDEFREKQKESIVGSPK